MEEYSEAGPSNVRPVKRRRSLSVAEALRMILVPDGNESEDDYEELDSEESELVNPPPVLDKIAYLEEDEETLEELAESLQLEIERIDSESDDDIPLSTIFPAAAIRQRRKSDFRWRKSDFQPPADTVWKDSLKIDKTWINFTPLEFFNLIFDDALFAHITEQTNIYAFQTKGIELGIKINEIKTFIGILLKLGIVKAPTYKYFWKTTSRYSAIADSMARDRFDRIKSVIHFNDNAAILPREDSAYDKLFRVRPLINSIRANLLKIPQEEHQAVDEQMIPTKAHNSLKQYMPKKPHKWGYKVISRAGESGFIYDFLIYTGKDTIKDNENVGLSSAYVLKLIKNLPAHKNYKIYYDNWFSSVPLIDALNEKGILCLSTVRANRLKGLKLKEDKELKREGRGALDFSIEQRTDSVVVKWFDNKSVHLLSNYAGVDPIDTCDRWDRKLGRRLQVQRPFAVKEYNKFMGGVDLCDMLIELYRINFKSNKWYMRIFFYLLDMCVVNAWLLHRRVKATENDKKPLSLLEFKEDVASGLISSNLTCKRGRPSSSEQRPAKKRRTGCHPSDSSRLDQLSHWPDWTSKPQRCRQCIKAHSNMHCQKCNVNLCCTKNRNCFYLYHQK